MSQKKFGESKTKNFSGMNPFTLSKLQSKEFAEKLIVHRVSELMHVWFNLKVKVKKNQVLPCESIKTFCRAKGIWQMIVNQSVDNSLYSACLN